MERLAPAKINLALHILGRRPDGYHELDTVAVFADIGDRISVRSADRLSLSVCGPLASHAPPGADNLVLRAAAALQEHAGHRGGAEIRLEKHLPSGAGLGGGSADAAAVLDGLNTLWELGASRDELCAVGVALGADVPMCTAARALRARGTGERIDPIEGWPALPLVLVWPGRAVSTAAAFAGLGCRENAPLPDVPRAASAAELAGWLMTCRNDLEGPAMCLAPEIGEALGALRASAGCLFARMSGSGAGCVGLYAGMAEARAAAASIGSARQTWWTAAALAR